LRATPAPICCDRTNLCQRSGQCDTAHHQHILDRKVEPDAEKNDADLGELVRQNSGVLGRDSAAGRQIFHKRPEAKLASKQSFGSREYQLQHDRGKD
jgi:hypothetical protein